MLDYILDYTDLHAEYEAEQERRLEKYPKCDCCGESITDDYFYNIDGTFICESCMRDEYRKNTEDYMED
jgi:formylmethanofuran dehydrogenase subunit E